MTNLYNKWMEALEGTSDGQTLSLMTQEEIQDAFADNISFGTGGLRGIMGLGTNRLNRYTIERVTHGLAKVILFGKPPKSVGIAYDTRFNSEEYAKIVSALLSSYGIDVYIFDKPMPTPALSFAIKHLSLGWGVCITASHNPKEYNGYKVYDYCGVQITDAIAKEITDSIEKTDFFTFTPENKNTPVKSISDNVIETYFEKIVSFVQPEQEPSSLKIVYSALHGTGANAIPIVLEKLGYSPICIQQNPDGAFGGLNTPNPEEPVAYRDAISEAGKAYASILLATDPDCDRVGVMVKTESGYELLNGNQVGALLIDYLAQTRTVKKGDTVVSTIVSGFLGEMVAKGYGLEFVRLLTGFKYIGEYIEHLPKDRGFFFGYEESYGYLADDGVRDKDAVIASALIIKMAGYYESKGMTLLDRVNELSEQHGYCLETLCSVVMPQSKQKELMNKLRSGISLKGVAKIEDYKPGLNGLPPADVLKLYFNGNAIYNSAWAAIRPSGTEPKLKLYVGIHAKTYEAARDSLETLKNKMLVEMDLR